MNGIIIKKYFLSVIIISIFSLILFSCDKYVSRSPVEPEPSKGFIYVNSTPSGFTIFQNGRNTGRITPDSLPYLEQGVYNITLTGQYYKDTTFTVDLAEDAVEWVEINYLANPSMYGKLYLDSKPHGAEIVFDDSLINHVTPYILEHILPGKYRVVFKQLNYRDGSITTIVESSETKTYYLELRDTSQWVDYRTNNSGITSNLLGPIAVDQNNVKWIGSLDNGLIRYDGHGFTTYNNSNSSIPYDRINCISVDNQNRIWVGTDYGIGVFDGVSWIIYNHENSGLFSDMINGINFDNQGVSWISTSAGLVRFDGVNWQIYNDSSYSVWAMDSEFDNDNVLWIGTRSSGIVTLINGDLNFLDKTVYNYPTNRVYNVTKDNFGYMWFTHALVVGQRGGISYWDGSSFTSIFIGTTTNEVHYIFIDEKNNKWICTNEVFVKLDSQNTRQNFNTQNSLINSDKTNSLVVDKNGNVWITTPSNGLNKYKPPK